MYLYTESHGRAVLGSALLVVVLRDKAHVLALDSFGDSFGIEVVVLVRL
jgi:hypothetical protein